MPAWRAVFSWFALTPLLVALLGDGRQRRALSPRDGALLGYLCGFLWYAVSCSWIFDTMHQYGGLSQPVSGLILVLFALYLGLYHALFGALCVYVRTGFRVPKQSASGDPGLRNAIVLSPFLWTAVELARARITGFPWDLLGNAQVDNLALTRLAPIGGVMSMSFAIALVNAAFAAAVLRKKQRFVPAALALTLVVLVEGAGRLGGEAPFAAQRAQQVAVLMQENLEVGAVGRASRPLALEEELQVFAQNSLLPMAHSSAGWHRDTAPDVPTVIVWPEAPSHLQSNLPPVTAALSRLAAAAKALVIAGTLGVDFSSTPLRGYYLYDSATLFGGNGSYLGRYDKIHLVPWGEYIPFKQFFSFAQKLTEGVGDMDRGRDRTVFSTGGHRYGVFICYESIFGDEVRQFARDGAEVLVNISDDGWYGESGAPWQHLNMARMRAIENHRWILRSTNTGVTTAIDPEGRIAFAAPRHVRDAYVFPFAFVDGTTFYTEHGDWFAWLCLFISAAALGLATQEQAGMRTSRPKR